MKTQLGEGFETLEQRLMLSGNVNAFINSAGDAIIQGDSSSNEVLIEISGEGDFNVIGLGETTINFSEEPASLNANRDLRIAMNAGDDGVIITGPPDIGGVSGTGFDGNIRVLTGSGADKIAIAFLNVIGTTTINSGGGDDVIGLENVAFGDDVFVSTRHGNDIVAALGVTTLSGSTTINIDTGIGNDSVLASGTHVGRALIGLGRGDDLAAVLESSVFGTTRSAIRGGIGSDTLVLDDFSSQSTDTRLVQFEEEGSQNDVDLLLSSDPFLCFIEFVSGL